MIESNWSVTYKIDTFCLLARRSALIGLGKHLLAHCEDNVIEYRGQHYEVAKSAQVRICTDMTLNVARMYSSNNQFGLSVHTFEHIRTRTEPSSRFIPYSTKVQWQEAFATTSQLLCILDQRFIPKP